MNHDDLPMNTGRQQSSQSMSKIQLRDGKQLSLPPWMAFHHLPEFGIASRSQSSGSALPSDAVEEARSSTRQSRRSKRKISHQENNTTAASVGVAGITAANQKSSSNYVGTYTAPQVSASNYKTKKDIAKDCLYPPTTQEIYGHLRYLSEEGMKLVMKEIDDSVRCSLRYSATKKNDKRGREKAVADDSKMERKKEDWQPDLIETLAQEIHNYFDMFQPDFEDDEGGPAASLKTDEGDEIIMTESEPETDQRDHVLYDMIPKKYNPTLLPMITIKCYPNILDRVEMTKGLMRDLSEKNHCNPSPPKAEKEKSPCICIIKSTSDLVQQGHLMTEILSQCISNDPNGEAFALELQRQRKRQKSHHHGGVNRGVLVRSIWSWTESLVEWAGFTEVFDSIVVILEVRTRSLDMILRPAKQHCPHGCYIF